MEAESTKQEPTTVKLPKHVESQIEWFLDTGSIPVASTRSGVNIAMLEVVSLERLTPTSLTLESAPSSKPSRIKALVYWYQGVAGLGVLPQDPN